MKASKQQKKPNYAMLIGFAVAVSGVGFFMFGLPKVLPPAWMQAHEQTIAAHYHIFIQGVDVPSNIGIDPKLYNDHSLDEFGINGFAPIHTHDTSGTVHIETARDRPYTMGYFLSIWGVKANSACLVIAGDYCQELTDFETVVLHDGDKFKLVLEK